jgi:hypothetical protein
MIELEFLTLFAEPGDTVLYAGAAPCTPLPLLLKLFPDISWVLYDPRDFDRKVVEISRERNSQVRIINGYFTNETIRNWRVPREKTLFMSDIRTGDHAVQDFAQFEQRVEEDNQRQVEWYRLLRPRKAILKYRPPYSDDINQVTTFLEGEFILQPWTKSRSGEVRVIPTSDKLMNIRLGNFQDLLASHNLLSRVSRHPLGADARDFGVVDECFDCASEVAIWDQYLRKKMIVTEDTSIGERASQTREQVLRLNAILSNGKFTLEDYKGNSVEEKQEE